MKIIFKILFVLGLLASLARADTIEGYDTLGMAMYCPQYLAAPPLPGVSSLMNTFGNPINCLEKRAQQGGLELVQMDLIDATCWRNHTCAPGVPKPTDLKIITARAREFNVFCAKHPGIKCQASPALEHDEKNPDTVRSMMEAAKAGCPLCDIIQSPMSGVTISGYPVEKHGTQARAYSISGDGSSIFDGDNISSDGNGFVHNQAGTFSTYAWFNELNLRCTGEKTSTPPKQRTEKPTQDLFRQAYLNMQPEPPKPAPPAQCKQTRDIMQGKEIMKPNAESYCNGQPKDPRGNKPLLIIRKAGKPGARLNVLNPAGKSVGAFCYYGSYPDMSGTFRWYMGNCSGQTPTQLYKALGSEWGFAQLGNGQCLRFNAVRRQGTYR